MPPMWFLAGWVRSRGLTGLRPQYDREPVRRLVTARERRLSRQNSQANGGDRPLAATVDKALAAPEVWVVPLFNVWLSAGAGTWGL